MALGERVLLKCMHQHKKNGVAAVIWIVRACDCTRVAESEVGLLSLSRNSHVGCYFQRQSHTNISLGWEHAAFSLHNSQVATKTLVSHSNYECIFGWILQGCRFLVNTHLPRLGNICYTGRSGILMAHAAAEAATTYISFVPLNVANLHDILWPWPNFLTSQEPLLCKCLFGRITHLSGDSVCRNLHNTPNVVNRQADLN